MVDHVRSTIWVPLGSLGPPKRVGGPGQQPSLARFLWGFPCVFPKSPGIRRRLSFETRRAPFFAAVRADFHFGHFALTGPGSSANADAGVRGDNLAFHGGSDLRFELHEAERHQLVPI